MAYEYGTQGATLDFPNPYRIENQFLALRAGVLGVAGVLLLMQARGVSQAPQAAQLVPLLAGGLLLVVLAVLQGAQAAMQLRVFFGRGQPPSLAPDIAREATGTSPRAQALAETLRQGAIALAEPGGALNGVLYSLHRHLVTAPAELRAFVEIRFANLFAVVGLLLLFGITWLLTAAPSAQSLAAAVYVALGGLLIVRSYLSGTERAVALKPLALAALLGFAIVGTVLIGRAAAALPQLAWLDSLALPRIALVLLLASAAIEALGLVAGLAHVDAPPPASTANEQVALSFNADPNLLLHEIDRELQRRWVDGIPNRRYQWQAPAIEPTREAGNFAAAVLEESQPMPPQAVKRLDWGTCLAFPRFWWLAVIDVAGVALTVAGVAMWVTLGAALAAREPALWALATMGFILVVVGGYALRVAHRLWGRLDFESTITWVEFGGAWARAQVGLGSQWNDRVRSERAVVNVESMTLRAWVVKARSVIFSYRDQRIGARTLVGMSGDVDAARDWVRQVRAFAQAQSSVVVPQAAADVQRLAQLRGANELAGSAPAPVLAAAAPAPAVVPAARHCIHCGTALHPGARFCHACGHAQPEG